MKTIAQQWQDYREKVISRDAPPIQVSESRRAFYAGAQALFFAVIFGLDPGSDPTEADERRMQAIHDELQQFAKDVAEGRA